jgi:hypothetical protein
MQIVKQMDDLARRGLAQASVPSNEHPPQLRAQRLQFVHLPIKVREFPLEEVANGVTRGASCAVPPKDVSQLT